MYNARLANIIALKYDIATCRNTARYFTYSKLPKLLQFPLMIQHIGAPMFLIPSIPTTLLGISYQCYAYGSPLPRITWTISSQEYNCKEKTTMEAVYIKAKLDGTCQSNRANISW
jgi:hypothetical protein